MQRNGPPGAGLSLLVLATALSRLPFLDAGFGFDPDANRVVVAARIIRNTGTYEFSRRPGYPVQEYLTALLVPGGTWAVNGATCVMSCICVAAFALWLRRLGVKDYLLLAAGFALVPVIYVNSTCAMDYLWALAFLLCATLLATMQWPLAAGVCAGLAIGSRITSGAMLLPLAMIVVATKPSLRQAARPVLRLWLAALVIGALCFVPVFVRYGMSFLRHYYAPVDYSFARQLRLATLGVWGALGCVALVWAAIAAAVTGKAASQRLPPRELHWVSAACATAIVLYTIAFTKLPDESGYLVPLVPFAIALASLWMTRPPSWVFALLLCASPFVDYDRGRFWRGQILSEHQQRLQALGKVREIIRRAEHLPTPCIVVVGAYLPGIQAALSNAPPGGPKYLYLFLDKPQLEQALRDGNAIYFVEWGIDVFQRRVNGIQLYLRGARLLPPVPREH